MLDSLTLPQTYALLMITPDGRPAIGWQAFDTGLGGAVLAELAIRGSVELKGDRVVAIAGSPSGDPVLDGALGLIAAPGRTRTAARWVPELGIEPARRAVLESLVGLGLLEEGQRKTLGLFASTVYPEHDGTVEAQLRTQLAAVLAGGIPPVPRLCALVGLLDATRQLRSQFGPVDTRTVAWLTSGEWASPAVKAVFAGIQTAVIAAVVATTTASAAARATSF